MCFSLCQPAKNKTNHGITRWWSGQNVRRFLSHISERKWRKLKEMPSNTSTASPPVGLCLPPPRMKWRGPTRNSPLCGVHEAMQNAHNLLILAQAGKIKPSGCWQMTEEPRRVCRSQRSTHTHTHTPYEHTHFRAGSSHLSLSPERSGLSSPSLKQLAFPGCFPNTWSGTSVAED